MKRGLRALLSIGVCAFHQIAISDVSFASPADDRAIAAANAEFYAALNSVFTGEAKPMDQIWSHREDVSYMGPDGLRHLGWDAVRSDWNLLASKRLWGKADLEQTYAQVGETISAISGIEVGENVIDGKPQKFSLRATNIFRKENGQWKMIAHHTDKLPYLEK